MRYSLFAKLQTSYSHDGSKTRFFEEYFDAIDIQTAAIIARAMLQSHQIRSKSFSHHVEKLEAVLKDDAGREVWTSKLVPEETCTIREVITPEHFSENYLA